MRSGRFNLPQVTCDGVASGVRAQDGIFAMQTAVSRIRGRTICGVETPQRRICMECSCAPLAARRLDGNLYVELAWVLIDS